MLWQSAKQLDPIFLAHFASNFVNYRRADLIPEALAVLLQQVATQEVSSLPLPRLISVTRTINTMLSSGELAAQLYGNPAVLSFILKAY